jgi:hypothetical protein
MRAEGLHPARIAQPCSPVKRSRVYANEILADRDFERARTLPAIACFQCLVGAAGLVWYLPAGV